MIKQSRAFDVCLLCIIHLFSSCCVFTQNARLLITCVCYNKDEFIFVIFYFTYINDWLMNLYAAVYMHCRFDNACQMYPQRCTRNSKTFSVLLC